MNILVADGDSSIRQLLPLVLQPIGTVRAVADAAQAMRAVIISRPDVLVTDLLLPGMTGLDLIDNLRAGPADAQVPAVVFSACGLPSDREAVARAGAVAYVTRPFDHDELLATIERAVRRLDPSELDVPAHVVGGRAHQRGAPLSCLPCAGEGRASCARATRPPQLGDRSCRSSRPRVRSHSSAVR